MFNMTARTLRYYEELGLLQPDRRGKQRIYRDRDRVRIQLILRGRRLGFGLQDISEMLDLYDADPTEISQLTEVLKKGDEKLREVDAQIRELTAIRAELQELKERMQELLDQKMKGE